MCITQVSIVSRENVLFHRGHHSNPDISRNNHTEHRSSVVVQGFLPRIIHSSCTACHVQFKVLHSNNHIRDLDLDLLPRVRPADELEPGKAVSMAKSHPLVWDNSL